MQTARFAGVVDVPLFRPAYDLPITAYQGFDASPRFSRYCQVPLLSFLPSSTNTNDFETGRIISIIPTLNGYSEVSKNPTQTTGLTGMSYRQNWVDGFLYLINEGPSGDGGTNYRWNAWRELQSRVAGVQTVTTPPRWLLDAYTPDVGFSQPRLEFSHPVLPGYDWRAYGNAPMLIYNWANNYTRVYGMFHTPFGWKCRNLFTCAPLPVISWPLFLSGSVTAVCRNEFANSFGFGYFNRVYQAGGTGAGYNNYMFVSKGTKANAYVVNYRAEEYDPDTIDLMEPRWDAVTFDDPIYASALDNVVDAQGWRGGFIFTLDTGGAGRTGLHQEIIVTDPLFTQYYVLRFVPQEETGEQALIPTNTVWSVKIDTEGTVWFYNGGTVGFKDAIWNSYSPGLFFNPTLRDFDLPALTMPCYNTCLPGYQ